MCGISGIINKEEYSVPLEKIKNMNDLIIHRGPDDEGYYFGKNFSFGHRRLAILDLSKDGHQPMDYSGRYIITYNGEVYNYLEIKEELIKDGYTFKSRTDTEVVLASYDKWGFDCVNRFNGMWAFALYDKERKIIFCSRDRFGVKPFYYTEIDNKFAFGSEIKQLLLYYPQKYVNKNVLIEYIVLGLEEHTNETFFENIFKLEQSHNLIYDLKTHTYEIKRYYAIKVDGGISRLSEKESVNLYKQELERSIRLRLRSDVKVGTCLSGGLDSSSIATIASKIYSENSNQNFNAITAKSIEKEGDETYYANLVVKNAGLHGHIVQPTTEDFMKNIDEVIYSQEEPFGGPSIFMQYFVMKKAKELGCKVMLDGQGGDETLVGYELYYSDYLSSLLLNIKLSKFLETLKNLKNFKTTKVDIFKGIVSVMLYNKILLLKRIFGMRNPIYKLQPDSKRFNHIYTYLNFKNFQKREIFVRFLPHLLRYEDKNSMRHSIETRLPFIDYKSVECAISINEDYKVKKGYLKYILRKAVEPILPHEVVWRTNKFGFEAPTNTWLSIYKQNILQEIKDSKIVNNVINLNLIELDNVLLWRLFNVARWENLFNVSFTQ
ncbi:MAG: asparagine synthase (glutamine-hydrolyzing) [Candidatus Jettenia sp.]|nr:asparagine synthase (glutamine-hydrolyzing) [Candidatus Jettenia sp.]